MHEMDKPDGWITIDLRDGAVEGEDAEEMEEGYVFRRVFAFRSSLTDSSLMGLVWFGSIFCRASIPAFLLQIVIIANHLNGKDTHVRGLKVWGPKL